VLTTGLSGPIPIGTAVETAGGYPPTRKAVSREGFY